MYFDLNNHLILYNEMIHQLYNMDGLTKMKIITLIV